MKMVGHLVIKAQNCRGCRSCQLVCSVVRHGVFNPAKSVITLERDEETGHTAPVILPLGCDLCGGEPACLRACPYGTIRSEPDGEGYKILVQA
jgi:carbon-monoxide dehydrogenase iron sulfur subunit